MPLAVKAFFEVRAGVVPGVAQAEVTRRFEYTTADFEKDRKFPGLPEDEFFNRGDTIFSQMHNEALRYYSTLVNPARFSWVDLSWMWL